MSAVIHGINDKDFNAADFGDWYKGAFQEPDAAAQKRIRELRNSNGLLGRVFNPKVQDFALGLTIGGAASMATRLGAISALGGVSAITGATIFGVPLVVLGAGAAAGAVSGAVRFGIERRREYKIYNQQLEQGEGAIKPDSFSNPETRKRLMNKMLVGSALGTVGGGIGYHFMQMFGEQISTFIVNKTEAVSKYVSSMFENGASASVPKPLIMPQSIQTADLASSAEKAFSPATPERMTSIILNDTPSFDERFKMFEGNGRAQTVFEKLTPANRIGEVVGSVDSKNTIGPVLPEAADTVVSAAPATLSLSEKLGKAFEGVNLSARGKALLAKAIDNDSQAQKDLAVKLFNGLGGLKVNKDLAMELYNSSAALGNHQAQTDLAYITRNNLGPVAEAAPVAVAKETVQAPIPEAKPVEIAALPEAKVAEVAPATPLNEKVTRTLENVNLSTRGKALLAEALKGDAESQKDVAFKLFNGKAGFPLNKDLALEMYTSAASLGSQSAKVDLAYISFHGLGNTPADPKGAIESMRELATNNKAARTMLNEWLGIKEKPSIRAAAASATEQVREAAGIVRDAGGKVTEKFASAGRVGTNMLCDSQGNPVRGFISVTREMLRDIKVGGSIQLPTNVCR